MKNYFNNYYGVYIIKQQLYTNLAYFFLFFFFIPKEFYLKFLVELAFVYYKQRLVERKITTTTEYKYLYILTIYQHKFFLFLNNKITKANLERTSFNIFSPRYWFIRLLSIFLFLFSTYFILIYSYYLYHYYT